MIKERRKTIKINDTKVLSLKEKLNKLNKREIEC